MNSEKVLKWLKLSTWALVVAILVVVLIRALVPKSDINLNSTKEKWGKLLLILETVEKEYVDEIDYDKVTEEVLPVIMSKLDPHSTYLPPVKLEQAEQDLQGGFDGIGIMFNVPNDTAIVTNVIAGGPSEKAGILSGDRIVKVDSTVIAGVKMPQDSMVLLMRGHKGTKVKIGVRRSGESHPISFDIIRDKIPDRSVDVSYMVNDTTGYLKLSKFSKTTYLEFLEAVNVLKGDGMRKLVVDLRGNTGGYLDQAVLLSNEFLKKGDLIVYMEGRMRPRNDIFADGQGGLKNLDLAIMIDETSASSSEIFAGAMQDNDRAVIYGLRSFGKGLVQEPRYLSDGSGIRLTVARYYTPTGRCIQKPYTADYEYEIYERYASGEMMSADSIKVNDSLKFTTPGGKVVYGGGGIIPDVFVPMDTTGVSDYLVACNRKSLQIKFANLFCDSHRAQLRELKDMGAIEKYLSGFDFKTLFQTYAAGEGVPVSDADWKISGEIIITQVEALISRNTPMSDDAFYPIYLRTDNTFRRAVIGR